jgi:hypothetical protein
LFPARSTRLIFCERLRDQSSAILDSWNRYIGGSDAPAGGRERLRDMAAVLTHLFDWAISSQRNESEGRAYLEAASAYGMGCRAAGLESEALMGEFAFLRQAVWECAQRMENHPLEMVTFDAALTMGMIASLRGFAKPELAAQGRWETSVKELAEQWNATLYPRL